MALATNSTICGVIHAVTAGAGAWDTGTCYRPVGHGGDHDYQVEPPTIIRPWHPGDPLPAGAEVLRDGPERRGEEVVLDCAACPYELRAHVDGRCPTEAEAAAAWGRS